MVSNRGGENVCPMNWLDTGTQNLLTSAQAVTNLKNICKELVENSIDAEATFIQVTLKNDYLQVVDDGLGLDPSFVIHRNHTTKIQEFDDIEQSDMFGFRGTALHSIIVLCNVTIRSSRNPPLGVEWKYQNGKLVSTTQIAMKRGTSITVSQFFHNLPVRLTDFQKNQKKFQKECIDYLYHYTLLPIRFKIITEKSLDTNGNLPDTIQTLFGAKQFKEMTEMTSKVCKGWVSRPQSSALRKDRSRQYCFLNNRPCTLPKLAKLLQGVYKEWPDMWPCYVLFLYIDMNRFDRNVSPDKLTIIMDEDDVFLQEVADSVSAIIEPLRGRMDFFPSLVEDPGPSINGSSSAKEPKLSVKKYTQTEIQVSHVKEQCDCSDSSASSTPREPKVYDTPTRFVDSLWKAKRDEDAIERRFSKLVGMDHPETLSVSIEDIQHNLLDPASEYKLINTKLEEPFMLKKETFSELKILGQFNLGFILASYRGYVFIVDQHASDEKSRYEMYCRSKMSIQPLISYAILT
jgi:DNA mismatch repair protein PMS2